MPSGKIPHLRKVAAAGDRAIHLVERTPRPGPDTQYRLLFQSNPNPMWIFDAATLRFLAVNKAAVKLYGWSREEFLRMTVKGIRPPEEVPKLAKKLALQRGSRLAFVGEWRHWKKDHTVFDVEVTISCIQFEDREARLTMVKDITERKRAEEELRKLTIALERRVGERTAELTDAHDRLRAVTDSAPTGILTLNQRGFVESVNPAAAALFGYSLEELCGRNVCEFMASPHGVVDKSFLAHYAQAGDQRFLGGVREVRGRRKDGHLMTLELTVSHFTHRGRRQFVAMVRDITRRKRLERELLEVGERERQRLGHDLHDGLGQHLHALYYMAALLEKETKEASPERARDAGRLAKQLEHALELSRSLARGLQPVNAVPEGLMIALRELAERTRELYRVGCRFECHASVPIHRHAAANHLYRIAQEAVNNAMKHGKPKWIRIRLSASPQRIVLGVRDNGVGIREQAGRARGMGLHIMQYRADAINGSLVVQRHPAGGTEVVCTVTRQALLPLEETFK